jgi:hypothetical protein
MSNVIMMSGPTPNQQAVQKFMDTMNENHRADKDRELQRQQL